MMLKLPLKLVAQKTDSKKINTKADAKTTAKTGAQKTDSKK